MKTIYKTVSKVLSHFDLEDSGFQNRHCCLCLVEILYEDHLHVNDMCQFGDDNEIPATESISMSTIIKEMLGQQIADMMDLFTALCQKCATSLLAIYKFRKQCEYINNSFNNAFLNLENCFGNVPDDLGHFKCLYVTINVENSMMEQMYDEQAVPKELVAKHFTELVKENNTKRKRGSHKRDFSTIFIKTSELMADPNSNEFKCKICSKVCASSGTLRQHFFSIHFKKEFECDKCNKRFGTKGLLNSHMKDCHLCVPCELCGKVIPYGSIRRHRATHVKEKLQCPKCGRVYKKRNIFLKHIEQVTCEMPSKTAGHFVCDTCNKHYKLKFQLKAHIKYEHSGVEAPICKWCGKKYYTQSALKTHTLKHTGEKNFVCDECGGKFVTKQSLLNHSRLHTGERPYPCNQCDQSFLSASRRKEHIEKSHMGFTFECDLCGSKCSSKRSMIQHRRKHLANTVVDTPF